MDLQFFILAALVHAIGSILDIVSSLGFEKLISKRKYRVESNTALAGIWLDKDGNFAEKIAIGAFIIVAVVHAVLFFVLPGEYKIAANMIFIVGIIRGYWAFENFSKKAQIRRMIAEEEANPEKYQF